MAPTRGQLTRPQLELIALRNQFLAAVSESAPDVLKRLQSEVLPVYQEAAQEKAFSDPASWPELAATDSKLKRALLKWAGEFNLHPEQFDQFENTEAVDPSGGTAPYWVLEAALLTLEAWTWPGTDPKDWSYLPGGYLLPSELKIQVPQTWQYQPDLETRSELMRRVTKDVKAKIKSQVQLIEMEMESAGWRRPSRPHKLKDHMRWLVKQRVFRLSIEEIAEQDATKDDSPTDDLLELDAYRKALNRLSKKLGFRT